MEATPQVLAGAASTRSESDVRRDRAIQKVREAARREGLSPRLTQEVVASTQQAFAMADFLAGIGGRTA